MKPERIVGAVVIVVVLACARPSAAQNGGERSGTPSFGTGAFLSNPFFPNKGIGFRVPVFLAPIQTAPGVGFRPVAVHPLVPRYRGPANVGFLSPTLPFGVPTTLSPTALRGGPSRGFRLPQSPSRLYPLNGGSALSPTSGMRW
jgi:hypothetical protein